MKLIYKAALLVLLAWLAPAQAEARERILSFDSTISVARDGTLEVRERIKVYAEGQNIRRGIYRDFPTIYQANGGRTVVIGFAFVGATRDGRDEPWRTENRDNGVRIYLGSKSVELPHGEHTYELVYRTDRQMGFFADHDELYWNVTGNGWMFAIERATATVLLPADIPRDQLKLEAYTGAFGAKGRDYQAAVRDGVPHYSTTRALGEREGLTIVASWPKGFILPGVENPAPLSGQTQSPGFDFARDAGQAPSRDGWSPLEMMLDRRVPHDNGAFWYTLLGFLALIAYYYFIWDRVGRDPPGRVLIPEYQPPADHSPASMRYILRMNYDNECFGAAVLSLAVKGYLRIQQDAGVLGFGKTFTLTRTKGSEQPLTADEHVLLKKLFEGGDALVLKQENHRRVGGARLQHYRCLKNLYSSGFFRINGGWHFLGIVISLLVLAVAVIFPGAGEAWPRWHFTTPLGWATVVMALGGMVANGVFGWLLRAPTPKGQAAMDHIRGFRMYLEVAEGEELKRVTTPPPPLTAQLFESYLPAALALGVQQKWAERFASVLDIQAPNYQPAWYAGPGFDARRLGAFSSDLGSSLSSAISASSTPPGSSSGSGGGGSSGGGGGGGGGGGW
ncbi:MAG: hypothetical protein K0Q92_2033 [Steroidobacteraceae bacterium]|nr:hypothetical protein [Steroidobacteraceae bacterium]